MQQAILPRAILPQEYVKTCGHNPDYADRTHAHHAALYCVTLRHTALHGVTLCYIMSHCVTPSHTMSHCLALCHTMLPRRHPVLEESLKQYFGDNTTQAHLKMADVPGDDTTRLVPCTSEDSAPGPFPLIAVRNVFVLPGECHHVVVLRGKCHHVVVLPHDHNLVLVLPDSAAPNVPLIPLFPFLVPLHLTPSALFPFLDPLHILHRSATSATEEVASSSCRAAGSRTAGALQQQGCAAV